MDAVPARIRVAVVAPHLLTRAALRTLLQSADRFEIVSESGRMEDALQPAAVDVVIIDVLPGTDPAPIVNAAAPANEIAIVVLLDETDLSQCSAAIAAGAASVVGRQTNPQALFAAIDRVYAGETFIERSILSGVARLSKQWNAPLETDPDVLSDREREVYALVMEGLKNKEIAQQLFISEATVRHHLTSIFGKLGVSNRLEMLAEQRRRPAAERARSGSRNQSAR